VCGCPARGCLEAIPSGGEYKSTVSASDPVKRGRERGCCCFVFLGGWGSNDHFLRAECALTVDCVEKCSPAQSKES